MWWPIPKRLLIFSRGSSINHPLHQLIYDVLGIGAGNSKILWKKIDRDINVVADKLAKKSQSLSRMCDIHATVLSFLAQALVPDGCGSLGPSGS